MQEWPERVKWAKLNKILRSGRYSAEQAFRVWGISVDSAEFRDTEQLLRIIIRLHSPSERSCTNRNSKRGAGQIKTKKYAGQGT